MKKKAVKKPAVKWFQPSRFKVRKKRKPAGKNQLKPRASKKESVEERITRRLECQINDWRRDEHIRLQPIFDNVQRTCDDLRTDMADRLARLEPSDGSDLNDRRYSRLKILVGAVVRTELQRYFGNPPDVASITQYKLTEAKP